MSGVGVAEAVEVALAVAEAVALAVGVSLGVGTGVGAGVAARMLVGEILRPPVGRRRRRYTDHRHEPPGDTPD